MHEPALVVDRCGGVTALGPTGPAVGMLAESGYRSRTVRLEPGDTLLAFTDGIIEAQSSSGELYSEGRLRELMEERFESVDAMVAGIEDAVDRHAAGARQSDDLTLLAVRRLGRLPADRTAAEERI